MAPMYGTPNYEFSDERYEEIDAQENPPTNLTEMTFWYMVSILVMLIIWLLVFFCLRIIGFRQKTRNPQQRRAQAYAAARGRPSLGAPEPTIYVSPSNLPPPPKYEFMAPPSYEEVVGVHYPNFNIPAHHANQLPVTQPTHQTNQLPITQPISVALQGPSQPENVTSVTVVDESRTTSVTVART